MNNKHKEIKKQYLKGLAKLYYVQDIDNPRHRNNIRCLKCCKSFGWYDRFDFDRYEDLPKICKECAASEP